MVNRVDLRPDLDAYVATRFVQPAVRRIADDLAAALRRAAPDGKVWVTVRDERVRPTHAEADRQTVPANLRYALRKADRGNDADDAAAEQGVEMARRPRDPALHISNRINCRCESVPLPGDVARTVTTGTTQVVGPRVAARITTRYPRVVESEFPGFGDSGGGWARGAANEVAARLRAASARST